METFLALTFRPWDSHCIHVDVAAPEETKAAVDRIVGCYRDLFRNSNIFTVRKGIVTKLQLKLLTNKYNVYSIL